jgi:hypothetical protein
MQNRTPVPMSIAVHHESKDYEVGVCEPTSLLLEDMKHPFTPREMTNGILSKASRRMGLRFAGMETIAKQWANTGIASFILNISPHLEGSDWKGKLTVSGDLQTLLTAENNTLRSRVDVVCTPNNTDAQDFVLQAAVKLQLIEGQKVVLNISLEPRVQLVNTIPLHITVLTRVPHCFSSNTLATKDRNDKIHDLEPGGKMEVYSGGQTLAVKVRCSDPPCNGTAIGTTKSWIQIPMAAPLEKPMLCLLPFVVDEKLLSSNGTLGSEFFIAEANNTLPSFFLANINDDGNVPPKENTKNTSSPTSRTLLFTVANYGVDHTKGVVFEQVTSKSSGLFGSSTNKPPLPFGTFMEHNGSRRLLSLLPTAEVPIRLVKPQEARVRKTSYFRVDDVSMSQGGAQATPLLWDDGSESGYYAYRMLVSSFQSELHVIPGKCRQVRANGEHVSHPPPHNLARSCIFQSTWYTMGVLSIMSLSSKKGARMWE